MRPARFSSLAPALLITAFVALPGCDDGEDKDEADDGIVERCAGETRAETYAVGLEKHGEHAMVRFLSADPAPPIRGDNDWTIAVMTHDGTPMDDMEIQVNPWMPDHGHGTPVPATITPMGNGEYNLNPVNMFMAGYWEVTLELGMPEGEVDDVMFGFCVE